MQLFEKVDNIFICVFYFLPDNIFLSICLKFSLRLTESVFTAGEG